MEWCKMKVLFATTNPAKIKKYKEKLERAGIELITIKDLGFELNVDEKDIYDNLAIFYLNYPHF